MKDLASAMNEEKLYIADRMKDIETSLIDRIVPYGYLTLEEYFSDKQEYVFNNWIPEIYPIDVRVISTELENAIVNKKYGIYISTTDGLYAFHGSDEIDYELCEKLGICVAELYYQGGTIIGSSEDLGIEIVAPREVGLNTNLILNKFHEIISRYIDNVSIDGNDILINGNKVMGSMQRLIGDTFVWAAQISFADYSDIISQVCNKKSAKKPSYINSDLLSKEQLESEVLKWLQKQ